MERKDINELTVQKTLEVVLFLPVSLDLDQPQDQRKQAEGATVHTVHLDHLTLAKSIHAQGIIKKEKRAPNDALLFRLDQSLLFIEKDLLMAITEDLALHKQEGNKESKSDLEKKFNEMKDKPLQK